MWNGFDRVVKNSGITAGNKTTLEARGDHVNCNCPCDDMPGLCNICHTKVVYSVDLKEAYTQLTLESAPESAGIGEDNHYVCTETELKQHIADNIANWTPVE